VRPEDITVVIPTYKRPKYLARALHSVLQQEVRGVRIRVLDNASGDDTEAVVRSLSRVQPIDYVCHPTNIGVSANMLFAINSVETPYCTILNDDDLQLPGLLAAAIARLPDHPDAAAFCGRMLQFREADMRPLFVHGATWEPGFYAAGTVTRHMILEHYPPTAVVYRTEALKTARLELSDREMMARFADRFGFVACDRILGAIVVHPGGWSSSQSRETVRRVLLAQLVEYLRLETLTDRDKIEVVLAMSVKLLDNELKGALAALRDGDVNGSARQALARASAALAGIATPPRPLNKRMFYRLASALAGGRSGTLSRPAATVVHAGWRLSRAVDRAREERRDFGPEVRDALDKIAVLDRAAAAFYERLAADAPARPGAAW
jgi:glycosyltransferase involved in cell wall biosynthesis